jgi:hypothetical protein
LHHVFARDSALLYSVDIETSLLNDSNDRFITQIIRGSGLDAAERPDRVRRGCPQIAVAHPSHHGRDLNAIARTRDVAPTPSCWGNSAIVSVRLWPPAFERGAVLVAT